MSQGMTADAWDCKTNILKEWKQRVLLGILPRKVILKEKVGESPKVRLRSKFHSFELFIDITLRHKIG